MWIYGWYMLASVVLVNTDALPFSARSFNNINTAIWSHIQVECIYRRVALMPQIARAIEGPSGVDAVRVVSAGVLSLATFVNIFTDVEIGVAFEPGTASTPTTPVSICANCVCAALVRSIFAFVDITKHLHVKMARVIPEHRGQARATPRYITVRSGTFWGHEHVSPARYRRG
jgi:hypothetical protein